MWPTNSKLHFVVITVFTKQVVFMLLKALLFFCLKVYFLYEGYMVYKCTILYRLNTYGRTWQLHHG